MTELFKLIKVTDCTLFAQWIGSRLDGHLTNTNYALISDCGNVKNNIYYDWIKQTALDSSSWVFQLLMIRHDINNYTGYGMQTYPMMLMKCLRNARPLNISMTYFSRYFHDGQVETPSEMQSSSKHELHSKPEWLSFFWGNLKHQDIFFHSRNKDIRASEGTIIFAWKPIFTAQQHKAPKQHLTGFWV